MRDRFHLRAWCPSLAVVLALSSCSKLFPQKSGEKKKIPFGPTGIPPWLRGTGGQAESPGAPAANGADKPMIGITPEEDIVFTDPDNPDAPIPELSTVLAATKRGPWEESETVARQRSVREGKPMLIWFTDSKSSPMCKALSQELFSTSEFGNWATEKLVRLKIDASVAANDPSLSLDEKETRLIDIGRYNLALKKRYKVLGYPSLIVLNPSGEVVGRYRGYKRGDAPYLWGQLKHAEAVSQEAYKGWRAGLEKKGYREWQDRGDRRIFAKLAAYSDGELVLVQPDGTRAKTKEANLSDKDRAWIDGQKKIRNQP